MDTSQNLYGQMETGKLMTHIGTVPSSWHGSIMIGIATNYRVKVLSYVQTGHSTVKKGGDCRGDQKYSSKELCLPPLDTTTIKY